MFILGVLQLDGNKSSSNFQIWGQGLQAMIWTICESVRKILSRKYYGFKSFWVAFAWVNLSATRGQSCIQTFSRSSYKSWQPLQWPENTCTCHDNISQPSGKYPLESGDHPREHSVCAFQNPDPVSPCPAR